MNLRTALHLGLITSLGSLGVLLVSDCTEDVRLDNRQEAAQSSLMELLQRGEHFHMDIDAHSLEQQTALCDGQGTLQAIIYPGTGTGYAGEIDFIAALNMEGEVTGVRVTSHAETPGIGDVIETAKSPWVHSLASRPRDATAWKLARDGGDIDGISGATITLRGLLRGLDEALSQDSPTCPQ